MREDYVWSMNHLTGKAPPPRHPISSSAVHNEIQERVTAAHEGRAKLHNIVNAVTIEAGTGDASPV
jgi:hypothetical protein